MMYNNNAKKQTRAKARNAEFLVKNLSIGKPNAKIYIGIEIAYIVSNPKHLDIS